MIINIHNGEWFLWVIKSKTTCIFVSYLECGVWCSDPHTLVLFYFGSVSDSDIHATNVDILLRAHRMSIHSFSRALSCKRVVSSWLGPYTLLFAFVVVSGRCAEEEEKGFLHLPKSGGPRASCSPQWPQRSPPPNCLPCRLHPSLLPWRFHPSYMYCPVPTTSAVSLLELLSLWGSPWWFFFLKSPHWIYRYLVSLVSLLFVSLLSPPWPSTRTPYKV